MIEYHASPIHETSPVTGVEYVRWWAVWADDGFHVREVARFVHAQQKMPHPDAEGAARAEAARLNSEGTPMNQTTRQEKP